MTVILLEPHLDDAVLFATYTLLRENPMVVTVCSEATVQHRYGIAKSTRQQEWEFSMDVLGIGYRDWLGMSDEHLDGAELVRRLSRIRAERHITKVWAPLREQDGHEQHNQVAVAAQHVFDKVEFYATYRRGSARSHTAMEVVPEPDWPAMKFRAMACYESQINLDNTRPWFAADDCLREWVA